MHVMQCSTNVTLSEEDAAFIIIIIIIIIIINCSSFFILNMKAEDSFKASVGICVTTWRHTFPCGANNKIVRYGIESYLSDDVNYSGVILEHGTI